MTKQDYINQIIKSNIDLGFTIEEIMNDVKEAHKRHIRKEVKTWNSLEEYSNTEEGFVSIRNKVLN